MCTGVIHSLPIIKGLFEATLQAVYAHFYPYTAVKQHDWQACKITVAAATIFNILNNALGLETVDEKTLNGT